MLDPIGDASRAILDGHIVLSRALATAGHFPSIDVLESISRVGPAVTTRRATRGRDRDAAAARRVPRSEGPHRDRRVRVGHQPARRPRDPTPRSNGRLPPTGRARDDARHGCVGLARAARRRSVRMKRFRFRLDQVLHVRRVQEDQARVELLAANRDAHARRGARRGTARRLRRRARCPLGAAAVRRRSNARVFLLDSARRRRRRRARRAPRRARRRRRPPRRLDRRPPARRRARTARRHAAAPSTRSKCSAPKTDSSTTSSSRRHARGAPSMTVTSVPAPAAPAEPAPVGHVDRAAGADRRRPARGFATRARGR